MPSILNTHYLCIGIHMKITAITLSIIFGFHAGAVLAHASHQEKISTLNQALEKKPKDQTLYIQRGVEHSENGRFKEAILDFQKAEKLGDPKRVAFDLGVLHYRQGEFQEARNHFDEVLSLTPKNPNIWEYRARISRDLGDYKEAVKDLKQYFKFQKGPNPGLYISAANMQLKVQGAKLPEAIAILDQGMKKLGIIPQLQLHAVLLEQQHKHYQKAVDRLQSLAAMLGNSPEWKVQMGELLMLNNQHQPANVYFDQAKRQLNTLRKTTARTKLLAKLENLKGYINP